MPATTWECADVRWIDLADPTVDEINELAERYDFHPLAVEDAMKHGQRPKLEHYPNHAFLVVTSANNAEVDVFFGADWVVTVRELGPDGCVWDVEALKARIGHLDDGDASVGRVIYHLLDTIVDGHLVAVDDLTDRIDAVQDSVFDDEKTRDADIQPTLFAVRRELLLQRKGVAPIREVLGALARREVEWLDDWTLIHLQDVFDHVLRALDSIDLNRDLIVSTVEGHLAVIANRQNEDMKRMTAWGAILVVATLIAGVYGMNFDRMPELHWRYGYAFALGLMAASSMALWWYFRRRDWL